jgi:hypothetical protein
VAAASLQRMYNSGNGLFCRKPDPNCWWDSANELTFLIDYSRQTGSRAYLGDIARTFSRARYAGPSGRSLDGPLVAYGGGGAGGTVGARRAQRQRHPARGELLTAGRATAPSGGWPGASRLAPDRR